jgi:hypothetical protein
MFTPPMHLGILQNTTPIKVWMGMTCVSEKNAHPCKVLHFFFDNSCPTVRAPNTLVYALVDTWTKVDTRPTLVVTTSIEDRQDHLT